MPTRRKRMRNAVDREAALARYQELLQTARLNDREAFRLMVEHRLWEAEGLKAAEMFARDFDRTPETFRNWLKRDGYADLIDPVKSAAGKAGAEAKHVSCQKDFGTDSEPPPLVDEANEDASRERRQPTSAAVRAVESLAKAIDREGDSWRAVVQSWDLDRRVPFCGMLDRIRAWADEVLAELKEPADADSSRHAA